MRISERDIVKLRKILVGISVALPLACLLAALVFEGWPAKRFLIFYLAPILSIAAVWASIKIRTLSEASWPGITIDAAVFSLAMARFTIGDVIPISGHMLFFTYTLLTIKEKWYKAISFFFILETSYFKLWIWTDLKTWLNGLILGTLAGIIYWLLWHQNKSRILLNPKVEAAPKEF